MPGPLEDVCLDRDPDRAQFGLALSYYGGESVPQDYAEAVRWYRLAAEQGYAQAMLGLTFQYALGEGVQRDFVKAHMWANLAASQSSGESRERAVDNRDRLSESMTSAQITEAQRLAREWEAAHPREP